MAKDPAFLFYSKDWLQGTSQMMPEEKGIYIDLLAHQHQDGYIPSDTKRLARMVGLPESDFLRIWEGVKKKFMPEKPDQLVNRKLTDITTDRSTKAFKNAITGTFAMLIRTGNFSNETRFQIKKAFKIEDFLDVPKDRLTERLTEWLTNVLTTTSPRRSESIANGNANGNANDNLDGVIFNIEEYLTNNRVHLEAICMNAQESEETVLRVLKKYHLAKEEGGEYPKRPLQLIAGLQKWLLNEKQFLSKNGAYISTPSSYNGTGKQGTSEARTEGLREWGSKVGNSVP